MWKNVSQRDEPTDAHCPCGGPAKGWWWSGLLAGVTAGWTRTGVGATGGFSPLCSTSRFSTLCFTWRFSTLCCTLRSSSTRCHTHSCRRENPCTPHSRMPANQVLALILWMQVKVLRCPSPKQLSSYNCLCRLNFAFRAWPDRKTNWHITKQPDTGIWWMWGQHCAVSAVQSDGNLRRSDYLSCDFQHLSRFWKFHHSRHICVRYRPSNQLGIWGLQELVFARCFRSPVTTHLLIISQQTWIAMLTHSLHRLGKYLHLEKTHVKVQVFLLLFLQKLLKWGWSLFSFHKGATNQ